MRMAACHISLEHVKLLSPVTSLSNSVTAFALFVAALQASMLDLGLWCTHHSSTLSRASSHLTAFLSSSSNVCWHVLLNCHRSFLTLAIVSSSSTKMQRAQRFGPTPPGCIRVGICTRLPFTSLAACGSRAPIGSEITSGHLYRWLLKSLLRHVWEQYTTS